MDYIEAKTIISKYTKDNPWFGMEYNMNIYRGCNHGCIYCDSRSECYHIQDFDHVMAKKNALEIIEKELKSKKKSGVIATGAMSDPYNPLEKQARLTRGALELISQYGYGAAIATKSDLIVRDIPILSEIKKRYPVLCKVTITTADDEMSRKIEPFATPSSKRFKALEKLAEAGIFSGILLMPVLPYITDSKENIKAIVENAHQSGVKFIYAMFGVTLRANQRAYYYQQLDRQFKGLKEKYIKEFGEAYSCYNQQSVELRQYFKELCEKYQILYRMEDIIKAYKEPYKVEQLSLFDF